MKAMAKTSVVYFERRSTDLDGAGQQLDVWSEVGRGWASVEPLGGRENFVASGEMSSVTHQITTSYQASLEITPADRIRYRDRSNHDRYFDIQSIINTEERNREWILNCVETISTHGQ